ncbi:MAG TPA: hypothetical protein ENJ06_01800 [Phycisphaeraceae bacterium]|nr:hypothetical protein [Phycisphaeraceae bacterium]
MNLSRDQIISAFEQYYGRLLGHVATDTPADMVDGQGRYHAYAENDDARVMPGLFSSAEQLQAEYPPRKRLFMQGAGSAGLLVARSSGDYYRPDAIPMLWHFLCNELKLPADRLEVRVFPGEGQQMPADHDSAALWKNQKGLKEDSLRQAGPENWWRESDQGRCGPCCSVHYHERGDSADPGAAAPEIARLTFAQYEMLHGTRLIPLGTREVETAVDAAALAELFSGSNNGTIAGRGIRGIRAASTAADNRPEVSMAADPDSLRVAVISIPKSGTNLLMSLLKRILPEARTVDLMYPEVYRNTESRRDFAIRSNVYARRLIEITPPPVIFHAHSTFTDSLLTTLWEFDVRTLFLMRDPRAVAVSFVDYVMKNESHPAHRYFHDVLPDFESRLRVAITGTDPDDSSKPFIPDLESAWKRYERWLRQPDVLQLRYEGLVDERFGGWAGRQRENLQRIVEHLGLSFTDGELDILLREGTDPNRSVTFHKGGNERWREAFSSQLQDFFRENAGRVLEKYRYK